MKSLVEYIQEQLKETSKYAAEFTVKNNTINVDDLINALSHSHGSLPTKDLSIDVEDDNENEEPKYMEYAGIKDGVLMLKYKSEASFVNKDIYDTIIKDLDEANAKEIKIDFDGILSKCSGAFTTISDDKDCICLSFNK